MFSVMSCSPEVMKRLTPSMCQVPSGCWMALVRPAPTSEPASGSVSTMVAPQPLLDHELGPLLLLLGAVAVDDVAKAGPAEVHVDGRVGAEDQLGDRPAQRRRDADAAELVRQVQPPPLGVHEGLVGLLERLRQRHRVGLRVEDRRVAVGVGEGLRQRPDRQAVDLGQDAARGVLVGLLERPRAEVVLHAEDLEQVELEVPQVALVVAHLVAHSMLVGAVPY